MLKSIAVSNFKSIANVPVELGRFNVLIGSNAAGKTNFVDSIRFVHDTLEDGVSSAVGRRLGWENVLTRDKDKSEKIEVAIQWYPDEETKATRRGKKTYKPVSFDYGFRVGCSRKHFLLDQEVLRGRFRENGNEVEEKFERSLDRIKISGSLLQREPESVLRVPRQARGRLFLETGFFTTGSPLLGESIGAWRFYELNVNSARCPSTDVTGNTLLSDGSNLAAILDKLNETRASRQVRTQILDTMANLIPGFQKWDTAPQLDGSLGFRIHERGISKGLLPKMISDGTIRLLCVLLVLLHGSSGASLICIDEPERYLHPQVLGPLVEIMRNVAEKTQLIITTQSAELVKCLRPDEVLMVDKRDKMTCVRRADDIEMVDKFMEDFTMDELWLGGYLKGGRIL